MAKPMKINNHNFKIKKEKIENKTLFFNCN